MRYMGKINKMVNIALIFMLIGVFLGQDLVYALRPPMSFRNSEAPETSYRIVSRPPNLGRIAPAPETRAEARRFRYVVIGSGVQGAAVAFDLAKADDTRKITLVDKDQKSAEEVAKILPISKDKIRVLKADASEADSLRQLFQESDVVIGAAHYALNAELARVAAETGAHFVDMGGNTGVVLKEFSYADVAIQNGASIIPDLGVAPGMADLLALDGISEMDVVNDVKIRVGGLPLSDQDKKLAKGAPNTAFHNPLRYRLVFSVLGLINEYMGEALAIRNGQVVAIPTFGEREYFRISSDKNNRYEAFPTSGGTSTLPFTLTSEEYHGKVKNLDYMTIRYAGHADIIQAFIDMGFFDETKIPLENKKVSPFDFFSKLAKEKGKDKLLKREAVHEAMEFLGVLSKKPMEFTKKRISPREFFAKLASKALEYPDEKDKLILSVQVSGEKAGQATTIEYYYNLSEAGKYGRQFSEMARTTGFPVSATALMLARGEIKYVGAAGAEHFVPTGRLIEELRKRGINISKRVKRGKNLNKLKLRFIRYLKKENPDRSSL